MNGRPTTCALALGLFIFVVLTYEAGASNTAQRTLLLHQSPRIFFDAFFATRPKFVGKKINKGALAPNPRWFFFYSFILRFFWPRQA
jgi:hypothetical protein